MRFSNVGKPHVQVQKCVLISQIFGKLGFNVDSEYLVEQIPSLYFQFLSDEIIILCGDK